MVTKVVDASALAALIFDEPGADQIDDRLNGASLVAPALLEFEITNVCLTKLRQSPGQRDALLHQLLAFGALSIEVREIDRIETVDLAERMRLTAYDASYLWLARALGAELVTLDRRLGQAAASLSPMPQT